MKTLRLTEAKIDESNAIAVAMGLFNRIQKGITQPQRVSLFVCGRGTSLCFRRSKSQRRSMPTLCIQRLHKFCISWMPALMWNMEFFASPYA